MLNNRIAKGLVLNALAVSGFAHADSSVTLYGIIDTSILYVHNSNGKASQIAMESGSESGSRWGLKGSEDLGGGLKTIFQLENGFNSTTGGLGQGGRMFGRQAYFGLSDNTWGTLTLGRQYDPVVDFVQPIQPDNWLGGYFTAPGDVDNADNSIRISNAIKWASPTWAGFQVEAMYALGGVPGSVGSGQTYSGAATYTAGPVTLAAGFMHIDNGNAVTSTRQTSTADSLFNSAVNSAYASARSIDITRAGGNYVVGPVTLGGYYSFSEYNPDAASTFVQSEKYHNGAVYAVWQITPAVMAELGYDYLRSLGDSSAKYHQVNAAVDYNLSKRTDLYGVLSYNHASGTNGLGAAQAVVGSYDINSGRNYQAMVTLGLRHKF